MLTALKLSAQEIFEMAYALLRGTRAAVAVIAQVLGFPEPAVFAEWFEGRAGICPWKLRQSASPEAWIRALGRRVDVARIRRALVMAEDNAEWVRSLVAQLEAYWEPEPPPDASDAPDDAHPGPSAGATETGNVDALTLQMAQPTIAILEEIAKAQEPPIRRIVEKLARCFFLPGYTVERLGKETKTNPRLLKRLGIDLGLTLGSLIRECRMEMAMRFLSAAQIDIEMIAIYVGYDSGSSLRRLCKWWCGLKPKELQGYLERTREAIGRHGVEAAFSWYFWFRYERGLLREEELRRVIGHLKEGYEPG